MINSKKEMKASRMKERGQKEVSKRAQRAPPGTDRVV
jgi:hypothetical protein